MRRVRSAPNNIDYDADESDSEDLTTEYHHLALQLLDLMHTLHAKVRKWFNLKTHDISTWLSINCGNITCRFQNKNISTWLYEHVDIFNTRHFPRGFIICFVLRLPTSFSRPRTTKNPKSRRRTTTKTLRWNPRCCCGTMLGVLCYKVRWSSFEEFEFEYPLEICPCVI